MALGFGLSGSVVSHNCKITLYPDGRIARALACSRPIFRSRGWIPHREPRRAPASILPFSEASASGIAVSEARPSAAHSVKASNARSKRRAQQRIVDLIESNPILDVFFTLTVSSDVVDRTDYSAINKRLQQWLADRVRRRGLKYIAVYEYHNRVEDNGKHAIHVHGLCNHSAMRMVYSGHKQRGKDGKFHKVYNVTDWPLGTVTTAMYTYGDSGATAAYISKYISKADCPVGGRWYMHGGQLAEPVHKLLDVDYFSAPGRVYDKPEAYCQFKYIPVDRLHEVVLEPDYAAAWQRLQTGWNPRKHKRYCELYTSLPSPFAWLFGFFGVSPGALTGADSCQICLESLGAGEGG